MNKDRKALDIRTVGQFQKAEQNAKGIGPLQGFRLQLRQPTGETMIARPMKGIFWELSLTQARSQ